MPNQPSARDEVLALAATVEPEIWERHVRAFVQSFVLRDKQDRWLHRLLHPTTKTRVTSYKLWNDLNRSYCLDLREPWSLAPDRRGVYDDFWEHKYVTFTESMIVGPFVDGIWSLVPGELALFFFHEGEILLCEK
jgi:hypothetical protein